jgi:hypothetical protein
MREFFDVLAEHKITSFGLWLLIIIFGGYITYIITEFFKIFKCKEENEL